MEQMLTEPNEWCELIKWVTEFFFCSFRHWLGLTFFVMALFGHFVVKIDRKPKKKEDEE